MFVPLYGVGVSIGEGKLKHIYEAGKGREKPTFLLLHGTGGTEQDLIPLAEMIDSNAGVLSVRGNVLENGMPRFFKRLAEGVFDEEDLQMRTEELKQFLDDAAVKYHFDRDNVVAIGYSNGANIAANLLFHYEKVLKGAILHHPMVPRRGVELPNLAETEVFIAAGKFDPLCPPEESRDLEELFVRAGADVTMFWGDYGHQLASDEVRAAHAWYRERFGE